jgi:hypothetical protein
MENAHRDVMIPETVVTPQATPYTFYIEICGDLKAGVVMTDPPMKFSGTEPPTPEMFDYMVKSYEENRFDTYHYGDPQICQKKLKQPTYKNRS